MHSQGRKLFVLGQILKGEKKEYDFKTLGLDHCAHIVSLSVMTRSMNREKDYTHFTVGYGEQPESWLSSDV